ncbi:MAG: VOC family protein [Pseudomonadota bacterium]
MIEALDHVVLVTPDIDAGVEAYEGVLGAPPAVRSEADGAATALFRLANMGLELMAPSGAGASAKRLREIIDADGAGLKSLVFETSDLEEARRVLERRGLGPSDIATGRAGPREWRRLRLDDLASFGVKLFLVQHLSGAPTAVEARPDAVSALDHIVINTPNPDRAIALYGGKLGLRLALDRTHEAFGARMMFFRVGGLTLEIVHRLDAAGHLDDPDTLWGLTWAVADVDAAHARLASAGRDVSEVRSGRKPGTRVFTLRDGTLGVPTLFLTHEAG